MRIEDLDFELPREMIAQTPAEPRDSCRLMRLTSKGDIQHAYFKDLEWILRPDDVLVFNDSKVLPARVEARRATGGILELLFVRPLSGENPGASECWEVLARPSRRLTVGEEITVGRSECLRLVEDLGEGRWAVSGGAAGSMVALMERYGRPPLPPYIESYSEGSEAYQTVYARVPGSAAAPTAGLHFTTRLLGRLQSKGMEVAWVTLHVGLDTFLPIREDVVEEHPIHTESFEVPSATVRKLREASTRGGRVVAVGTTSARVLETLGEEGILDSAASEDGASGTTGIFMTPGYDFQMVDVLLTNFHLPRSTVLALTMAFAGVDRIRDAYRKAIEHGYRFFSFGDAMLIEGPSQRGDKDSKRESDAVADL